MKPIYLFFAILITAYESFASNPPPFPVFLKHGFSSVLEFEEAPSQVVIGDRQAFQVEKLKNSLIVRALVNEASSNMFVYFRKDEPRLFILTAADNVEPTYYKKFDTLRVTQKPAIVKSIIRHSARSTRLISAQFDAKKDYLTLEIRMTADSKESIKPYWQKVTLQSQNKNLRPFKIWAERQVVQKDSEVKARFVFLKPDVPRNLKSVTLLIPLIGYKDPVKLIIPERSR